MVKAAVTVTAVIISVFAALLVFITEKQQDEDKTVKVTADTDKSEHYTKVRTFLSARWQTQPPMRRRHRKRIALWPACPSAPK